MRKQVLFFLTLFMLSATTTFAANIRCERNDAVVKVLEKEIKKSCKEWSLNDLKGVTTLNLSGHKLEHLKSEDLDGLSNLTDLNLSNTQLKEVSDSAFEHTKKLIYLNLSLNSLTSLPSSVISLSKLNWLHLGWNHFQSFKIVKQGIWRKLTFISLTNNELIEFAIPALVNLEHLDLSFNRLPQLSGVSTELLPKLRFFLANHNALEKFPNFKAKNQLQSIDVSTNKISHFGSDGFACNANLKTLNLRNNPLLHLDDGVFIGCQGLQDLSLGKTQLGSVSAKLLEPLTGVQNLDLGENPIAELGPKLFIVQSKLKKLTVGDEKITHVDPSSLNGLPELMMVYIRVKNSDACSELFSKNLALEDIFFVGGESEKISADLLRNNTQLRYFYASGPVLKELPENLFKNNPHVEKLLFARNKIKSLPENLVSSCPHLRGFSMFNTELVSLPVQFFDHNLDLKRVELWGNPSLKANDPLFVKLANRSIEVETKTRGK